MSEEATATNEAQTGISIDGDPLSKFKGEDGAMNVDALSKSYLELESKMRESRAAEPEPVDDTWMDELRWDFDDQGKLKQRDMLLKHIPEKLIDMVEPMMHQHVKNVRKEAQAFKDRMNERFANQLENMIAWAGDHYDADAVDAMNGALRNPMTAEPVLERIWEDYQSRTTNEFDRPARGRVERTRVDGIEPFKTPEEAIAAMRDAQHSLDIEGETQRVAERMRRTPGLSEKLMG